MAVSYPAEVAEYGNIDKANVFKCTFSQALSALVRYEAWENNGTFPVITPFVPPQVDTGKLFIGTTINLDIPMICLVDTTDENSPGASWKPAGATGGSANPNRLAGTTNYVTQEFGGIIALGESVTWNMVVELPSDLETTDDMEHYIQIRYTYTGTTPVLTMFFNDEDDSGTEAVPVWAAMTPGTHGIRHCALDAMSPFYANIPALGTEDTVEAHVGIAI